MILFPFNDFLKWKYFPSSTVKVNLKISFEVLKLKLAGNSLSLKVVRNFCRDDSSDWDSIIEMINQSLIVQLLMYYHPTQCCW